MNTAIGYYAHFDITTGSSNTAVGQSALSNQTTSDNNAALGKNAGLICTTGAKNTFLGAETTTITTGSNNTLIGYNAAASSATVSNEITIGDTNITKFRIPAINFELTDGIITLKNGGTRSEVRWYCESSNAHYASIKAPAHADFSGDLTFVLPSG
ncbi:MAG: hypothetical protein CM15mV80_140 [uncultured marine virus]|nr:MAG: hypothetical protein CM15mV80_140 [uncultured marine virus]